MQACFSDNEYHQLWRSLSERENHVCTRQCEFKQVFGNMFYCRSSGQAHVCDQNCSQRIFFDNHSDICRLSRRTFPRQEQPMEAPARKRGGDDGALAGAVKRTASANWQQQEVLREQALAAAQQQHGLGGGGAWQHPQAAQVLPPGWAC